MTNEKCLEVIARYRERLEKLQVEAIETDYDAKGPDRKIALNHSLSMIPQMEQFIQQGRREKFFRWLGFTQGVLWSFGEFSLNELRDHNRPPEPAPE